MTSRNPITGK